MGTAGAVGDGDHEWGTLIGCILSPHRVAAGGEQLYVLARALATSALSTSCWDPW
jgi:hypothetical protein